jgi:hypothetical protein
MAVPDMRHDDDASQPPKPIEITIKIDPGAIGPAMELSGEVAILETAGGVRQSYRRKRNQPGRVLIWEVGVGHQP